MSQRYADKIRPRLSCVIVVSMGTAEDLHPFVIDRVKALLSCDGLTKEHIPECTHVLRDVFFH